MRPRFIVHTAKSSSSPIGRVEYYFLMHSRLFINSGLSPIARMPFTYMMKITSPSSFTMYKDQY